LLNRRRARLRPDATLNHSLTAIALAAHEVCAIMVHTMASAPDTRQSSIKTRADAWVGACPAQALENLHKAAYAASQDNQRFMSAWKDDEDERTIRLAIDCAPLLRLTGAVDWELGAPQFSPDVTGWTAFMRCVTAARCATGQQQAIQSAKVALLSHQAAGARTIVEIGLLSQLRSIDAATVEACATQQLEHQSPLPTPSEAPGSDRLPT